MNEPTPDPPGPMTATISLGADFDHPTSVVWKAFADIDQRVRWGVPEGEETRTLARDHRDADP